MFFYSTILNQSLSVLSPYLLSPLKTTFSENHTLAPFRDVDPLHFLGCCYLFIPSVAFSMLGLPSLSTMLCLFMS